jgi:cbb3-type cytochrome oxidase maturation protein
MEILSILIPVSLFLGAMGLVAFVWTMKRGQYDDPQGDASRILTSHWDDRPKPPQTPLEPPLDPPQAR